MKATLEHIPSKLKDSSFIAFRRVTDYFEPYWHYHPEIELTYIVKGSGTRFVGDSVEYFQAGDLVLLGSLLPHQWVSVDKNQAEKAEACVIQFPIQLFEGLPEFRSFLHLFEEAKKGICFRGDHSNIIQNILNIINYEGVSSYLALIKTLDLLAKNQNRDYLANSVYMKEMAKKKQLVRSEKVLQFIQDHYDMEITLEQISKVANLSPTAFCKWFKKTFQQTFTEYKNRIRVSTACHLLITSDLTISELAYRSGFDNSSTFNRVFKKEKRCSPTVYRNGYKL